MKFSQFDFRKKLRYISDVSSSDSCPVYVRFLSGLFEFIGYFQWNPGESGCHKTNVHHVYLRSVRLFYIIQNGILLCRRT